MEKSARFRGLSDAGKRKGEREADRELAPVLFVVMFCVFCVMLDFGHWSLCLPHAVYCIPNNHNRKYPRHLGQVAGTSDTPFAFFFTDNDGTA
jgi:hypothetical protein